MDEDSHPTSHKKVQFSHLVSIHHPESVASNNPLLDSAYQAARAAQKAIEEKAYSKYAVYVDRSRSLLESQRLAFERERLTFAEERKLWEMERVLLKSRITELEASLSGDNAQSHSFDGISVSAGLWQPNEVSTANGNGVQKNHHIWEGPIPGNQRPARVFSGKDDLDGKTELYIAPIEANDFGLHTSLDAALAPEVFDRSGEVSMPVPIEKVDSQLDGITLKSTALPPDVVYKAMTPPASISPTSSPPKNNSDPSKSTSDGKAHSPLKLKLSDLGPPDRNLVRDAGHTPMAILGTETIISRDSPNEVVSRESATEEEIPLEPVVTTQPVEKNDSYFPAVVDEDPALTGPLTLENDESSDSTFLSELDQKLLNEVHRAVSGPSKTEEADLESTAKARNEKEPELKLKDSTNFGTAFGKC